MVEKRGASAAVRSIAMEATEWTEIPKKSEIKIVENGNMVNKEGGKSFFICIKVQKSVKVIYSCY